MQSFKANRYGFACQQRKTRAAELRVKTLDNSGLAWRPSTRRECDDRLVSWRPFQLRRPGGGRPHAGRGLWLSLGILLLLSGCSFTPRPPEPAVSAEIDPAVPKPVSTRAPVTKPTCAWSHTKGVAEVVGLDESDAEFHFYPGDIRIPMPEGQNYRSGQEFKAILLRADGCTSRLEVVEPVP